MREYIDKQKLLMALNEKYHDMSAMPASYYAGFQYAIKLIEILNVSEEVAPVRHGRWIEVNPAYGIYECSVCRDTLTELAKSNLYRRNYRSSEESIGVMTNDQQRTDSPCDDWK